MTKGRPCHRRRSLYFLGLSILLLGLCGEEFGVNERHDTTLADDNVAEELVQSFGVKLEIH